MENDICIPLYNFILILAGYLTLFLAVYFSQLAVAENVYSNVLLYQENQELRETCGLNSIPEVDSNQPLKPVSPENLLNKKDITLNIEKSFEKNN